MGSRRERKLDEKVEPPSLSWYAASALTAALFAAISHWKLRESDVFWLIRAGREIFHFHRIQAVDSWTSTASGERWYNFQWLSSIAFYGASKLRSGFHFLPTLRSILILILYAILFALAQVKKNGARWYVIFILAPWFYATCAERLDLTPDLFGLIFFGLLLLKTRWDASNPRLGYATDLTALVFWANFQGGTVPIGIFYVGLKLLTAEPFSQWNILWRLKACGMAILSWFLTPIHFHVLPMVFNIAVQYHWVPAQGLDRHWYGTSGTLPWLIGTGATWLAIVFAKPRPKFFTLFTFLVLTLFALMRVQARSYCALMELPVLARAIELCFSARARKAAPGLKIAAAMIWMVAIPFTLFEIHPTFGFGVDRTRLPVGTTEFLVKYKPKGILINHADFGGYLVEQAPEFPVTQDGREYLFQKFLAEKAEAAGDPHVFSEFLSRNHYNLILIRLPNWKKFSPDAIVDPLETWYPLGKYALVSFDNVSALYILRTPENADLIAQHEYRYVLHGRRADFAVLSAKVNHTLDLVQGFREEIRRCLKEMPDNRYCLEGARLR